MLSILIPTYNDHCYSLVKELKKQADELNIVYEIIVQDDASKLYLNENSDINNLPNCRFESNQQNVGRTKNRMILAEKASFDLILFLDADVLPEKATFLSEYIDYHQKNKNSVIFGGYKYHNEQPEKSKILRYKYGKSREEKPAAVRNNRPFSFVFSGNMLLSKPLFLKTNFTPNENLYGMDLFFSYHLYQIGAKISHIDNAIFHLGLEVNKVFFEKNLESVSNRKKYLADKKGISNINPLLKYYLIIKTLKLDPWVYWVFQKFETKLKKSILSDDPNLLSMDLYRLGYICKKD